MVELLAKIEGRVRVIGLFPSTAAAETRAAELELEAFRLVLVQIVDFD